MHEHLFSVHYMEYGGFESHAAQFLSELCYAASYLEGVSTVLSVRSTKDVVCMWYMVLPCSLVRERYPFSRMCVRIVLPNRNTTVASDCTQ